MKLALVVLSLLTIASGWHGTGSTAPYPDPTQGSDRGTFRLVDEVGNNIDRTSPQTGLLLFNGKTVCDDYFNNFAASAICGKMGYSGFVSWVSGREYFDIQDDYDIGMDDVYCVDDSWDSCTFRTREDCDHYEDVFLTCQTEGSGEHFTLIDESGRNIDSSTSERGLLLFQGNTVCNNEFNDTAADAICKTMGYPDAMDWTSDASFEIQSDKEIGLDEVRCGYGDWESCRYQTVTNCEHSDDVFLTCRADAVTPDCTWDMGNKDVQHCCNHPDHYYDSRCTSGASRGQLVSLLTFAAIFITSFYF